MGAGGSFDAYRYCHSAVDIPNSVLPGRAVDSDQHIPTSLSENDGTGSVGVSSVIAGSGLRLLSFCAIREGGSQGRCCETCMCCCLFSKHKMNTKNVCDGMLMVGGCFMLAAE